MELTKFDYRSLNPANMPGLILPIFAPIYKLQ